MQPIVLVDGVARFQPNKIVRHLLDVSQEKGYGLNQLAILGDLFSREDWEQFYQLIGYSVSGYGDLSKVGRKSVAEADVEAAKILKRKR